MDFWIAERASVQHRIAQIENRIALLHSQGAGSVARPQRIAIMRETLARAKIHAQYIEQRILAHEADAERRADRAALVNTLVNKHSPLRPTPDSAMSMKES
jgi:hypothetical protein